MQHKQRIHTFGALQDGAAETGVSARVLHNVPNTVEIGDESGYGKGPEHPLTVIKY